MISFFAFFGPPRIALSVFHCGVIKYSLVRDKKMTLRNPTGQDSAPSSSSRTLNLRVVFAYSDLKQDDVYGSATITYQP